MSGETPLTVTGNLTADPVLRYTSTGTAFATFTLPRLGVPPTLARTLRSTNAIESMISICRQRSANVKRWRDGQMALRWCAAGMVEAGKQFRRVNGHLHLSQLRAALDAEIARTVGANVHD